MRRALWLGWNSILLFFLPAPLLIVAAVSITPDRFMAFPPTGFSLVWYQQFLASPDWLKALGTTALIATGAACFSTAAAVFAALSLTKVPARVRSVVETAVLAPLIFPHAAVGVAMLGCLTLFRANGTMIGILLVHIILCGPFAYRPIAVALQKIDGSMPEAAMSLGAREGAVFRRVILPLMKPGIVTALLFTFIISFDEVTVTLFLVSPDVTTLPVMIWGHIRDSADPVVAAISTLLILMTAIIVLAVERLVGLQMFVNPEVEDPNRVRR